MSRLIFLVVLSVTFVMGATWQSASALSGFEAGKLAYDNQQFEKAFDELAPLAMKGNPGAQYYLGKMYRHGRGVKADIVKSTTWLHSAAKQGYIHAQYDLGVIYRNMAVTKGIFAKAVKWLTAASLQGHVEAQFQLGKMYRDGYGVEVDNVKALALFISSAKRVKNARGPRAQLEERMSKKDIARAKKLKLSVLKEAAKIRSFADSQKTVAQVSGICGDAGGELHLSTRELKKIVSEMENCVGEDWGGELCSTQIDNMRKTYLQFNYAVEIMKKHC